MDKIIDAEVDSGDFEFEGIPSMGLEGRMQKLEDEFLAIKDKKEEANQFGPLMQICLQIGEKFGKIEKEMADLKEEVKGMKAEFGKLAEENGKMKEEIGEMKNGIGKQCEIEEKREAENSQWKNGLNEAINRVENEIGEMREKIQLLEKTKAELAILTDRFGMVNEMVGTIKWEIFKWDPLDCGSGLKITEKGRVVTHSGSKNGCNTVRTNLNVSKFDLTSKKPTIPFYFEGHILKKENEGIGIGFCCEQFPLEGNWIGQLDNSIGFWVKDGIHVDGKLCKFDLAIDSESNGEFNEGNVIGLGLRHCSENGTLLFQCFATINGKFQGLLNLPAKFAGMRLFPSATLYHPKDSIRVNVGNDELRYNPMELIQ